MSSADYAESSRHAGSGSGLKLVLPSLKTVQALKGKGKAKLTPVKEKIPRPIKLKPLKEVLTKLIVQIKRKDDYAFFLAPVEQAQTPGYADVVKRPMDFGTMTTKVQRGKYRSLEEFAADVRLVTANAKTFNPPGTIYYTEAEKIEAWALEHVSKAAATVIEYETDWNIEIEHDDEPTEEDEDGAADKSTAMDVDDGASARGRSPSVLSLQTPVQGGGRRTTRGGTGKKPPGALSETLEPDGGLPGAKDGLGAFAPGSDWAQLMLALKLKGKRYRTKKERMRMEKGGPPYHADGSLDYPEMEDPFSVLSVFVPEPPSRPLLTPLYPTLPSLDSKHPPFPAPVNIPPASDTPILPSLLVANTPKSSSSNKRLKRRHWTIIRNAPGRGRVKDKDEEEFLPPWKVPREGAPTDFGTYATFASVLAAERGAWDVVAELGSEERLFGAIRESVEERAAPVAPPAIVDLDTDAGAGSQEQLAQYWKGKDTEAVEYLRDVVYGGVDGLAYVRSLAEFVSSPEVLHEDVAGPSMPALGMPLANWVEQNIVGPLTAGRHHVLSTAARHLQCTAPAPDPAVATQVDRALTVLPLAARQLVALQQLAGTQLDMAALIRTSAELFLAEDAWAGADYTAGRRAAQEAERERALVEAPAKNAAEYLRFAIDEHREAEAAETKGVLGALTAEEGPEMLQYALDYSAGVLAELSQGKKRARDGETKTEDASGSAGADAEEPVLKKLRLNLLALAKRAPLDKIARLPADLVPDYLRNIVPTI